MALTFPPSPSNGQYYTDSVSGNRYVYNSAIGVWSIAANNVGMSVSSTPPGNVAPGALWYNREIGRTFLYYDDGDSKQWVETVPATGFFDSSTVASYANAAAQAYYTQVYTNSNAAFNTANAAYASANNVAPQVTPAFLTANLAYTTANLAYAAANASLQNTNVTLAGNLTSTGAITLNRFPFYEASANINFDYTINTGMNAFTPGPVAIANGVFVTIPDGSYWSVT